MLDAVARLCARILERRDREHELHPRHAVDGDRTVLVVRGSDGVGELGERRESVVVEEDLDRSERGALGVRQGRAHRSHQVQVLGDARVAQVARQVAGLGRGPLGVASVKPVTPTAAAERRGA